MKLSCRIDQTIHLKFLQQSRVSLWSTMNSPFALKESDFLRHKTVKTNDKILRFGVVMTPLSRKKCFWSCNLQHLKRCGSKINITGCKDYENTFARIESDCTLRFICCNLHDQKHFSLIMESWLLRNVGFYRSFLPFMNLIFHCAENFTQVKIYMINDFYW